MKPLRLLAAIFIIFAGFTIYNLNIYEAPKDYPEIAEIKSKLAPIIRIEGQDVKYSTLQERMEHYKVPAISIAYMKNHKIKWTITQGVRDKITNKPIDLNTIFQAASISKPTFATVLMKYRELNGLDLDAPVNNLLTSWQLPKHQWSDKKPVTLRRLLSHSAGTTVHGFRGYARGETVPGIIDVLNGMEPANSDPVIVDLEPSTQFRYSGGGTTLAQLILEDQSKDTLAALAKSLVFEPLSMGHSEYIQPLFGALAKNKATPYRGDGEPVEGGPHTYATLAAAGLWTTPSDLLKLAAGIQKSLKGEKNAILSQETAREMLTPQQSPLGIGFFLEGDPITAFSHGGANEGFRAKLFAHKDTGDGIAIMTNTDSGNALITEVFASVAEVMNWEEGLPKYKTLAKLTPDQYGKLIGNYKVSNPFEAVITLRENGGKIIATAEGFIDNMEFFPESELNFFAMNGTPLVFELDETMNVKNIIFAGSITAPKMAFTSN